MGIAYAKTALLLHFDGVDGATLMEDASPEPKNVTASGGAQISTSDPKLGGGAALFNGSTSKLVVAPAGGLNIGRADFTFAFYIKTTQVSAGVSPVPRLAVPATIANGGDALQVWKVAGASSGPVNDGVALAFGSGLGFYVGTLSAVTDGEWHHVAFMRRSGVAYCHLDGVLQQSANCNEDMTRQATEGLMIGARPDAAPETFFDGMLDEILLVTGAAIYPVMGFTPPAAPLSGESYWAEASVGTTKTNYNGASLGAVGNAAVDLGQTKSVPQAHLDALPCGFPSSQQTKLFDKVARTADATAEPFFDLIGYGRIAGTIAEKATPNNLPRKSRVFLYRHPDNRLVRSVWSDDAGNYEFVGVNPAFKYMVLATDSKGLFRAVIADHLTPEAIAQPTF